MIEKLDVPPELQPLNQWEEDLSVKCARKLNEIIDVVNDNQKALVEIFRMLHELNPSALPDDQVPHA